MNNTPIFNKQLYKPYTDAQYEPSDYKQVLSDLAKKFTNNLLYYITKDSEFYYINIIVPRFYDGSIYKCYYYFVKSNKLHMDLLDLYPEHFYIYRKNNFYYKFYENMLGQLCKLKYKNNKKIYIRISNDIYINTYTHNYKHIIADKGIIYNDKNNISTIYYSNSNYNYYSGALYYSFKYIDNYINIYNKTSFWEISYKFIGNFLIIILFI